MEALLVIDMQHDFAAPGGTLYSPLIGAIVPQVRREIDMARALGLPVIWTVDAHTEDDPEFKLFPEHGLEGKGRELVITRSPHEALIAKHTYSAFHGTVLAENLKILEVDRLRVVGCCTNICVLYTVADARQHGIDVTVVSDAVASFDPTAHDWALAQMKDVLGATVGGRG